MPTYQRAGQPDPQLEREARISPSEAKMAGSPTDGQSVTDEQFARKASAFVRKVAAEMRASGTSVHVVSGEPA